MLSNGHASVLQYIALHLTGYGVGIDDLKQQRQWGSITPGHPEHFLTPGVEVTTGPLGQGVGNAVGFALAERFLADRYNRGGQQVVDHRTWAFCSDGDMMEGVSSEASSYAGYLRLGKLTLLYDDNHITIDGRTEITFGEDVEARYRAYGWHTVAVEDANDLEEIAAAYQAAVDEPDRPTFIRLRSHIAWGAPNAQDTSKAHGSALGEDEVRATKQAYGWDPDKHFFVPDGVYDRWRVKVPANQEARAGWERRLEDYARAEPELAAELRAGIAGELPDGWDAELDKLFAEPKKQATRVGLRGVHQRHRPAAADLHRRLGRPGRVQQDRYQRRRQHGARARSGATSTSASASTAWGRSATAWPCTAGCGRSAPPSWSSPTTCGPACAWPT